MINIIVGNKSVIIDLKPGIRVTECNSAEGKTYLATLLKAYTSFHPDSGILILEYIDGATTDFYMSRLRSSAYKLILLDRAIMFLTEELYAELCQLAECAIVLTDIKNLDILNRSFYALECVIDFTKKGFFIHEDDV